MKRESRKCVSGTGRWNLKKNPPESEKEKEEGINEFEMDYFKVCEKKN